jgi:starch synthase
VRTVFTIHNIEYQGKMPLDYASDVLGVDSSTANALTYDGCINLMKGAIVFSDAVTTVSETYSTEILGEYYSHGLHYVLRDNRDKLTGIVNGIDPEVFDPSTDKCLYAPYGATVAEFKDKAKNKLFLQETLGLLPDPNLPIIAMVTRLVSHKGMDLVACVINEIMALGVQLVILGTGDSAYENILKHTAERYPGKMAALITFDPVLANRIYAGADIFLMPSKSEPCGLSQMVAMRYGTIPVVRETGGLKDTVSAYDPTDKSGRGFTFVDYNAHEMLRAIERCTQLYRDDKKSFEQLARRDMKTDFSWKVSVKKYLKVYKKPSKK